ncbi:MAG TPA: ABC transporter ATP-binding protein [Thermoanaerobaculia bacterium]|nr:ABC transporter ATP-binding protein [Thermoanaerobaculia bacterium]
MSSIPTQAPVVELEGLEVRYGRLRALKGVSYTLGGRAIGLLGPNGAGKTTLLHTLLGFLRPAAGTARVLGLDVTTQAQEVRALLGYMPERDSFIAGMSGVRFVRLMAELAGLPAEPALERAHEALFYVGLGEARYRPMESYSLGMKQLAKLAQSIVHGPRLLLLDEPTAGLDPPARERMLRLIREIRDSGQVRIVISSHLLRDVEECCEEVLVLKDGRIAAYSNLVAERRTNRRFLEVETRGADDAFAEAIRSLGCELATAGGRRLKMVLPEGVGVTELYRLARERGVQLRRVNFRRDSLEDIFLQAMEAPAAPAGPTPGEEASRGGL